MCHTVHRFRGHAVHKCHKGRKMRAQGTHLLQVQLTEAEKRHIKTLAVSQGLTLRKATLQAFQAWELLLQSRARPAAPARGTRAGADSGQPKRTATPRQDRSPAQGKPASAPAGGSAPNPEKPSRAW